MMNSHLIIRCFSLCSLFNTFLVVDTWNLDVHHERIFRHPSNTSYFGYSLAAHQFNNKPAGWLVGSPGENGFQGAVYKCDITNTGFICNSLQVESPRVSWIAVNRGWLGATVVSSQGSVLACAPRSINEKTTSPKTGEVDGRCYFSSDNLQSFTNYNLPDPRWICMSGFSATFSSVRSDNGNLRPTIGAPTCYFPPPGSTDRTPLPSMDLRLLFPVEKWDKWYLGYAMASGVYGNRISSKTEFVLATVGFHISSAFAGKVYFLDPKTTKELDNLTGYQPGEHFGASLAVSDINGDGRDDVIIGAPHHTTDYESSELKVEVGAVYIYYQTSSNSFQRGTPQELIIKGQTARSRFGYSVTAIGDIDADGYNDLAVGAPYENDGSGTVYIYRGTSTGLNDRPSQTISGTIFNPPIKTFGFSITAADFDSNQYNDIVVGAYESAMIAYIPARPIAKITSQLIFVPDKVTLDQKECPHHNPTGNPDEAKKNFDCNEINFCITYDGYNVPKMAKVKVSLILDIELEKANRRILFLENNSDVLIQTMTLEKASQKCLTKVFYVKSSVYENSAIQAKMTVEMAQETTPSSAAVLPILPTESINVVSNSLLIFAKVTSWWEYLASILGAILILAIIVGVLYKLGFFKRKLPPTEQAEGEQLTDTAEKVQQENQ